MSERRNLGDILTDLGRISGEDVEAALEYQEKNGGYFGEALMALGILSREELEWGLASQFDLPYVFPDADSLDPEAVALVSPEWALANLTLPIMKTRDTLTVIVDNPVKTEQVEVLSHKTDLEIDLALCAPARIRDLIRQVYARQTVDEEGVMETPVAIGEVLSSVQQVRPDRFGVATRGPRAWVWYDDSGSVRRRLLKGGWRSELEDYLSPGPGEEVGEEDETAEWKAQLTINGVTTQVRCHYMECSTGTELLIRPLQEHSRVGDRYAPPPPGILSEVRILARSGSARFMVTAEPQELGEEILPHLPAILLDRDWRCVYVTDNDPPSLEEVFSMQLPDPPDARREKLEELRAFHFDVVAADISGSAESWASDVLDVAGAAFVLWKQEEDRRAVQEAGIKWEIHIEKQEGDHLEWSLEPLNI